MEYQLYIGRAMTKPVTLHNGASTTMVGADVLKQSILDILHTPIGSRLLLPEYGSKLHMLLFEPNDIILKTLLRQYIKEAIDNWEDRCRFSDIEFTQEANRIDCTITVIELTSNEIYSFVYPFYSSLIH